MMVKKLLSKLGLTFPVDLQQYTEGLPVADNRYGLWHELPARHVVLFLDFEGVLHTTESPQYAFMDVMERLLDKCPHLYITIIDPVRNSSSRAYLTALFKAEYFERLLGITQDFSKGTAPYPRAEECQDFVFTHRIKNYLVLDDNRDNYPHQYPFIIPVDPGTGLTEELASVIAEKYKIALQSDR